MEDNRSYQSTRSRGSNRNHDHVRERYGQDSPTQVQRDGGGSEIERRRSQKLRSLTRKIAAIQPRKIKPSHYRFKNKTHPRLPVRSLEEDCSHINQYLRWVDDKPTRSTAVQDTMLEWAHHFDAPKGRPNIYHKPFSREPRGDLLVEMFLH